jgi:hypothetical protein
MDFVFHDGGRAAAGYIGMTGDCVTRLPLRRERPTRRSMTSLTSWHKRIARANAKGSGQAAGLACFGRPINTISNRSDGDGPQQCRLVLDARFTFGPQSFRAAL